MISYYLSQNRKLIATAICLTLLGLAVFGGLAMLQATATAAIGR